MWFASKTGQKWSLDTGTQPVSLLFQWLFSSEHTKSNVIKQEAAIPLKPYTLKHQPVGLLISSLTQRHRKFHNKTNNLLWRLHTASALAQLPHSHTSCNAITSVNKRSFSSSELKIVHFLPFVAAYRAAKQNGFEMMDYEQPRKNVRIINCIIIIMVIKWCEEHNVHTSLADWCGREGGSEQRAVIDDARLFNFVCSAVEMARLCKYIPSLPSDARIRTLREVKHPLNSCVSRKICQ